MLVFTLKSFMHLFATCCGWCLCCNAAQPTCASLWAPLAVTLLGVRNDGEWLLYCKRARLLCWLVLCDLALGLPFRWCLVLFYFIELCQSAVVCVDCICSLSFVFLGGARRLRLSL